MFKKVTLILLVLAAALLTVVATRPNTLHVDRKQVLAAPPAVVFALVNDFQKWAAWSPWEKLDPSMQKKYEGAPSGVGASYYWLGNDKVGEGRMTILESVPGERIRIKLEFIKPWEGTNATTFTFAPRGEETEVTWAMDGPATFMTKLFSLVADMDGMIGKDFEKGLGQMKAVAEAEAKRQVQARATAATVAPPAGLEVAPAAQ